MTPLGPGSLITIATTDISSTTGPLTVASALTLPILRRALPEVIAGEESLDRVVRWVHVVDVPDPDRLLRGGELVLSTGLGTGNEARSQRGFVRSLSDQGAAGLLIELGYTYKQELPEALVAEARTLRLPLVATHRAVRFVDITEAIHSALVDRSVALLRDAQEIGDRLTTIVLERRGLDELLRELASALLNPVILENVAGQLVTFATYECSEQDLLEARERHRRRRQPGELSGRGWLAADVQAQGRPWGRITVLELGGKLGDPARVLLDRGAVAVALALLSEQHAEQLRARARGTFLVELMHQRLQEADAAHRATALDFPRRRGQLLPAALGWRSDHWSEIAGSPDDAWAIQMPSLRAALGIDRRAILGVHEGRLLLVCGIPDGATDTEQLSAVASDLRRTLARRGLGQDDVSIAFGGSEETWTAAGKQLARAAGSVLAARAASPSLFRDARRASLVDLLYALRRTPDLLDFAREQLGPLFDEPDERSRELLQTLEAYLACSGRKADAARALHLTRQSLYLRLERLARLIDADLDAPDTLLALHLAVRTLRLTQALAPDERL